MSTRPVQRQSQLITTFGPGAMVDLPTRSVLIGGLDRWFAPKDTYTQIDEPSLARYLENWLRERGRIDEGRTLRLLTPPLAAGARSGDLPGVDVTVFPTWFVCERVEAPKIGEQERRGRRLVRWQDLDPAGGRRRYQHEDGKKDDVMPLRFVGACVEGHLQDIDWRWLLHSGQSCQEPMWLIEEGTSASLSDLEIVCGCNRTLSLRDATKPGRLGKCQGRQPWLSADACEPCTENLRLLTRSAINAYFPQTVSVISLPVEEDALVAIVRRHLADLASVESAVDVGQARRFNSALRMDLEGYSDADVFERLKVVKNRVALDASTNPRLLEFDILASGRQTIGVNEPGARLYAETLSRDEWFEPISRSLDAVRDVVAVHRLREVMCLYGFTRFEPAPTAADSELEDIQLAVCFNEEELSIGTPCRGSDRAGAAAAVELGGEGADRWQEPGAGCDGQFGRAATRAALQPAVRLAQGVARGGGRRDCRRGVQSRLRASGIDGRIRRCPSHAGGRDRDGGCAGAGVARSRSGAAGRRAADAEAIGYALNHCRSPLARPSPPTRRGAPDAQ